MFQAVTSLLSPKSFGLAAGYIITLCPEAPERSWETAEHIAAIHTTAAATKPTTNSVQPTASTWSCQVGDVVPCCVDRQCLETCAGNQCCPDGTACPSASDDFALCPAPRLYSCPLDTTTYTTTPASTPRPADIFTSVEAGSERPAWKSVALP